MTLESFVPPSESTEETPAPIGQADFEKFKSELTATFTTEMDKRYAGWQKILAQRDEAIRELNTSLEELKASSLSEPEKKQLEREKESREMDAIRAENALLKLQQEFPEDVPTFMEILAQKDPRAQIEILRRVREGKAQEQPSGSETPPAEGTQASGNVEPNNPADNTLDGMTSDAAFQQDPSLADKLLKSVRTLRQ